MKTAILLFIFGLVGLIGCFYGATHHAMTSAVCFLLAWTFAEDWYKERNEQQQ